MPESKTPRPVSCFDWSDDGMCELSHGDYVQYGDYRTLERELTAEREKVARLEKDAAQYRWQPISTAPKDNKHPLLLAEFTDGTLRNLDHDGVWQSESESREMPTVYHFWASANGYVEEPTHWMYQPDWYAAIDAAMKRDGNA